MRKPPMHALSFALLLAISGGAQALSLGLAPDVSNRIVGEQVFIELHYDFSQDATLGGGVDLLYDEALLQYVGFQYAANLPDDPAFRRLPNVLPGELNGLAFGHFNGLDGPGVVGTYTFTALATGVANLALAENDVPAGGFISANSFSPQAVDFGTGQVDISAIPEPAAYGLFASGLALLHVWRRRRQGKA